MTRSTITAPAGVYHADVEGGVLRMRGIPYATAARFRPPVDITEGQHVSSSPAPAAPQNVEPFLDEMFGFATGDYPEDEHCQRLSIYAPANSSDPRLPVMFWIHGGSYVSGFGDMPITDPTLLVQEQQVVVVEVTYRLGVLGYLGDAKDRPANLGLLDQISALKWVARNIAAFGGDPTNITAFGQSAGGDAVAHLLAVPDAARLLRRAIVQSAPLGILKARQKMNAAMADAITQNLDAAPVPVVLAAQRDAETAARSYGLRSAMPFGLEYGHAPLPIEHDVQSRWDEAADRVELLIGCTSHEVRFFLPTLPAGLQRLFAVPLLGAGARALVTRVLTDIIYRGPARRFARRWARAGGQVTLYELRFGSSTAPFGAAHAIELALLFDNDTWDTARLLTGIPVAYRQRAGRRIRALWAGFARGDTLLADTDPQLVRVRTWSASHA